MNQDHSEQRCDFLHHSPAPQRTYCQTCIWLRALRQEMQRNAMQLQWQFLPRSDPRLRRNKTPVQVEKEVTAYTGHSAQYRSALRWCGSVSTHRSAGWSHDGKPCHASAELQGSPTMAQDHVFQCGVGQELVQGLWWGLWPLITVIQPDGILGFAKLKFLFLLFISWHLKSFYFMKIHIKRETTGKVSLRICAILLV